jgi:uncharacterized protein with GYD domain
MEHFIALMKLTDEGIKTVKTTTEVIGKAQKILEKQGGKMVACYLTMGEIDYVAVFDAPSDDVAISFVLSLGSTGNVRTTTMKAFKTEKLEKVDIVI